MDFLLSAHALHNRLRSKLKLLDCQEFDAFDFTETVDFSTLIMQRYTVELRLRNDLYCVGWGVKLYSLAT